MRRLARLWRNLVHRNAVERDLDDELQATLDLLVEEKRRAGMSQDAARRAARVEIGAIETIKDQVRDVRRGAWLDQLARDLQFGTRAMLRRPGFTAIAVLTIAIGIGATTAVFSVADHVLFKPLPFADADRLAAVWEVRPDFHLSRLEAAPLNYVDWVQQARSFTALAAYFQDSASFTGDGTPERLPIAGVTPNFMSTLDVRPAVGRWFEAGDGAPAAPATAILSYGLWQRRFGGDPGVVGRTIRLGNRATTVIGVMPRGFQFPHARVQVWVPVDYVRGAGVQSRTLYALDVVGRLRPDVSFDAATAELKGIAGNLARAYPQNRNSSAIVVPLQQDRAGDQRTSFLLLLGAAGLVFLIACANVAGLLLTRGARRDSEFAVRRALGASRGQLARQLLVEGVLLSGTGAAIGLLLATRTFPALNALIPDGLQGTVTPSLDLRLLAFGIGAALLTGIVFGLVPFRHAFQRDLHSALITQTRVTGTAGRRLQIAVAVEVMLGVVVLFSTGLMLQTIRNLETADIGFDKQNVLTARVEVADVLPGSPNLQQRFNFYREVLDRVTRLPNVVSAGLVTFLPYTEAIGSAPLRVEGQSDALSRSRSDAVYLRAITPGYLPTLRVPLLAGRGFSDQDTADSERVAIVTQRMNTSRGGNLLGRRVAFGLRGDDWRRVVGIVDDIRFDGVDVADSRGALYVPVAQIQETGAVSSFFLPRDLAIRTTGDPMAVAAAVQKEVWAINPNQPVANIRTLDAVVDDQIAGRRVQAGLFSTFAGLALLMAALGVYGLLAFTVAVRTRELGVRAALGASTGDLMASVSRGGLRWLTIGLAVGIVLAIGISRTMTSLLYGVEPMDWRSLVAATIVLGTTGIVAALLPVWRATRTDPVIILRAE